MELIPEHEFIGIVTECPLRHFRIRTRQTALSQQGRVESEVLGVVEELFEKAEPIGVRNLIVWLG